MRLPGRGRYQCEGRLGIRAEIYCIPSISSLLPVLSPPPLLVALLKPFWVLSIVGRLFDYADAGLQQR